MSFPSWISCVYEPLKRIMILAVPLASWFGFVLPDRVHAQTLDPQRGVWTVREALAKAIPATVRINLGASRNMGAGAGTGVIIDAAHGYIVTNRHVIAEPGGFRVQLNDGRSLQGQVVGSDRRVDLALIKVEAEGLKQIEVADASKIEMGDMVMAIGFPYGLPLSSSLGIVSAKAEPVRGSFDESRNSIQTDAAVNPGNSGGPLIDSRGRLVGINSSIQGGSDGSFAGIAFAIPSNVVASVVDRLSKSRLQIAFADSTSPAVAAIAPSRHPSARVAEAKPAPVAEPVIDDAEDGAPQMAKQLATSKAPAREAPQTVALASELTEADRRAADVPMNPENESNGAGTSSADDAKPVEGPRLGLVVEDVTANTVKRNRLRSSNGAFVVEVEESSPAKQAGILPGDTIIKIDEAQIASVEDLQQNIKARHGKAFDITFYRSSKLFVTAVNLGS